GLFATEKLVVVRRADRFLFPGGSGGGETDGDGKSAGKRDDPLADYVADPTDGMYLPLECERLDRRTKRGKALAKHGLLLDCPELRYERDTLPWLRGRARDRSLDLTPDAARMLFTIHGAEPGVLAGELEKLALFAAGAGQIDEAAVRTFMGDAMALSFFELSNAVEARDPAEALTVARRMIRQGLTDQRGRKVDLVGAVHMAMGSLRSTLATLWRAHDVAARGGGPSELEPHLGGRAWRAEAILRAGERYRLDEIRRGFDALTEALAAIHDTGGDPALALERTVLTICGGDRTPGARAKEPA
ncbi:MAG: DNA polymerase III subunit delta, partial [Planctomycetota bacterium]